MVSCGSHSDSFLPLIELDLLELTCSGAPVNLLCMSSFSTMLRILVLRLAKTYMGFLLWRGISLEGRGSSSSEEILSAMSVVFEFQI